MAQSTPAPSAGGPIPIAINSCVPMVQNNGGPTIAGIQLAGTSSGIKIQFTNETAKTANLINFSVNSNGTTFVIRDVGTFSPGVEITHQYRNGSGQSFVLPAFIAPQIGCTLESVHFTDGSVWRTGEGATPAETAEPAPGSSGQMKATPSRIDVAAGDPVQYFMISTREQVAGFAERDACQGIAMVTLVAAGVSSATYSVKPLARGSCAANVRDQDGHVLAVPITIR